MFHPHAGRVDVKEKIGVIYVGARGHGLLQGTVYVGCHGCIRFSYDPNHSVYKFVIWNPVFWPQVLGEDFTDFAARFLRMYDFEYERIGGLDPFHGLTDNQLADMKKALDKNKNWVFEVDWSAYMAVTDVSHYAYPRFTILWARRT